MRSIAKLDFVIVDEDGNPVIAGIMDDDTIPPRSFQTDR